MMRKYRHIIDICILLQKENYIWSNKLWDFCLPTVQKYLYFKDEYQCQYYFIIKDDYAACQEKKRLVFALESWLSIVLLFCNED